ncbi:MAG: hypothetical protein H6807_09965 [Planctomycetes bacterium]|nr:hypothetical protein [Planctomycetota bacterium]
MCSLRVIQVDPDHREGLAAAGLLDLAALLGREDLEPVKTRLAERQVHRLTLPDGRLVYVKRYFRLPVAAALKARLGGRGWRSGASREGRALCRLAELGIDAARVLAVLEESRFGLVRRAALVTLALPETRSLEEILCREGVSPATREPLACRLATILRRLHAGGVNHRDFYLGHLRLGADPERIFVMDLDRADLRPRVSRRWRVKDLAALEFSTPARVIGAFGRLRFLRRYLAEDLRRHRALVRAIAAKAARMRRHVERKVARGAANYHLNR